MNIKIQYILVVYFHKNRGEEIVNYRRLWISLALVMIISLVLRCLLAGCWMLLAWYFAVQDETNYILKKYILNEDPLLRCICDPVA